MRYLEALSFAIEDVSDNAENVGDEETEKLYTHLVRTLEKLEEDLIRFADRKLSADAFRKRLS